MTNKQRVPRSKSTKTDEPRVVRQCAKPIERARDALDSQNRLHTFEFMPQHEISILRRCRALLDALQQQDACENAFELMLAFRTLAKDAETLNFLERTSTNEERAPTDEDNRS